MQKSLPADTSEKEIFKNAPPHNKNKIHHSGQTLHDRQKRRAATNNTLPAMAGAVVIESFCFLLSLYRLDSFVRLNPPLRQAVDRYLQA